MEQAKLKQLILKVLKKDDRLWDEDKTELNQTLLLDLVENIDETVIDLLLQEKDLREKFFVKIKDVYVFKTNDFRFFMEENKVDNSYTAYKNRIGLTDSKKFLKDTNDVVLDFPYKDCVLEGGQSTEEGTDTYFDFSEKTEKYEEKQGKRKEIFFNSVLAHDEIDRLFDHKALTNWKRFTKDGEQEVKEIKRDEDGTIKENLIIKGNNLLALHSLKKQFAGKVKLIYIDPPYNTKGDGNTFTYNNSFNHSTWLTFMKNRLEIAKSLLTQDGVIAVAIDDEEQSYLKILMDDIFSRDNFIGTLIVQIKPSGRTSDSYFSTSHEYVHFYSLIPNKPKINFLNLTNEQKNKYKETKDGKNHKWRDFLRTGGYSTPEERPNSFYPIYYNSAKGEITLVKNNNYIEIFPIDSEGKKRVWRKTRDSFQYHLENHEIKVEQNKTGDFKIKIIDYEKDGIRPKSVWVDSKYDASSHGTKLLKSIFGESTDFSFPKSLYSVKDVLNLFSSEEDIILDYHAGSGTTAHAVLELNKEDGGNRKFIMIEQMDYINTVTCPRVQKVMEKENIDNTFIYFELAKWNETAKEKILACGSLEELIKFFDEMYERYFLNYNLKIKEFREKVIKEEEFKNLSLDEQKKMFISMLDNNQMYVNKTEMADKKFGINKEDQNLTSEFYNSEK
jgi:adenine-specific DNA-methyltransferase